MQAKISHLPSTAFLRLLSLYVQIKQLGASNIIEFDYIIKMKYGGAYKIGKIIEAPGMGRTPSLEPW